MKNLFLLLSFALMSILAFGQTPQAFKYQAVARDLNGNPVINQEISVKISILSGSPEGTVVYSEIHQTTTNSQGLLNLEVGRGTTLTGEFALIAWGNNASFIKTEMDLTGGDNFVFMGTSQLLSVPFSLFSDNGVPDGQNPGDMLYWDGNQWLKVNAGLNGQVLTFNDSVPVWGGVQLPIINTSAVTNISAFTANCGGNIASDGGSPVIVRGICWNSLPNPTTTNNKTTNGSGTGPFTGNMTGLAASSVYYVRAYATNSAGTSYGNEVSFTTTNGGITLTTTAITAITVNSATSGGNITNNGGSGVMARGVCWNTSPYPTTANSKTTNGSGNGIFVSELTGLAVNTLYYVRAYATNSLGTSYGQQLSFTTLSGIVTLTTTEVTEITATTAISGGEITSDGGSPVTARGVCWSTSQNPTLTDNTTNDGSGNGVFVSSLTGLLPDTLYYVRSYATNGVGTFYGNEVSFTTLPWTCGTPITIKHTAGEVAPVNKTVTYGTVTNIPGEPTKCWITSNLGADHQATSVNDATEASSGWYWQFNRKQGFKHDGTTRTPNTTWLTSISENSDWTTTNDPCTLELGVGWRIPTNSEWTAVAASGNWTNWNGPWNSSLKMHSAGYINESNGSLYYRGIHGFYWSNTQWDATSSWGMGFDNAGSGRGNFIKSGGFSLRCIKDETTTSQLNVTPANQGATALSGSTTFELTSNTSWTVEESISWLSVSPMSGSSDGSLIVTYEANSSSESRIGQITITAAGGIPVVNVIVTQAGAPQFACGQTITDERDGKSYTTVQIGTQCWMAKNLNIGTRIEGGSDQGNNTILEKYCYDNSESNCDIFGGLYQWYEMMQYDFTPSIKGICPTGWHLPTDAEWTILTTFLGGEDNAGGKMKTTGTIEAGTGLWTTPNTGATNSSGFTGFPSGRYYSGNFDTKGNSANFWSSNGNSESLFLELDYFDNGADRYWQNNWFGYSVRCLKDF